MNKDRRYNYGRRPNDEDRARTRDQAWINHDKRYDYNRKPSDDDHNRGRSHP